ncbi:MAG: hypothetical protein E3K32_09805 [wastewater metagenome]|nr:hypothetical protein [Candidatus Loosdrechtia aerotolerans]
MKFFSAFLIFFISIYCYNSLCNYSFAFKNCFAGTYYVSRDGSDSNNGSLSAPWETIKSSIPKLQPGDTLLVRGGTYYESEIVTDIRGTESNRITIKNYPGEEPVIDGGYREFREVPNSDWELYDSKRDIYRSVDTYPDAGMVYGYFGSDNDNYRLVSYERYNDLSSDNEDYTNSGNIYIGPGVFWKSSDKRIYIRLQPGKQAIFMGYKISSDTDPRSTKLYIFPHHEIFTFKKGGSYINIEGMNLRYQNNILEFKSKSHHISIKNCTMRGGRTPVLVCDGAHNLLFDGITFKGSVPPWIAWSDVKCGAKPGHSFQGPAIGIQRSANTIEIRNCLFHSTWDGINATKKSFNLYIHHNEFRNTRDDVVQLGSGCYDVEINDNKMIFVSKGVSRHGSGSSRKPGTKYVHHNIIDCSKPMLGGRQDPNKLLDEKRRGPDNDGMVWARPFGSHRAGGYGRGDPWKIYNNTVILGQEINNRGAGHEYVLKRFYRNCPQEVYNNIFIQTMDHWLARESRVADGSQIYDGNVYFRTVDNPKNYFFLSWKDRRDSKDFTSLEAFKSSLYFHVTKKYYSPGWEASGVEADPQLDDEYRPNPGSPAAKGAVPLPAGWPGNDGKKYRGALPPKD